MTDFLNSLNTLTGQTDAQEGFVAHPQGEFPGTITEVKQGKTNAGDAIIEIIATTDYGKATHAVWMPTANEMSTADGQKKVMQRIGRLKGLMVAVGVADAPSAKTWTWNQGENSVINQLTNLVGKKCWVSVKPQTNDPSRSWTNFSGPREGQAAQVLPQVAQAPAAAPGFNGGQAPSQVPDLGDLPF